MPSRTTTVFVCLIGSALSWFLCPSLTAAQQLGTVATPTLLSACPTNANQNFYSGSTVNGTNIPGMTCYSTQVSGCPGVQTGSTIDTQSLVYGVDTPSGKLNGTIVMLPTDGGETLPTSFSTYYVPYYFLAGYQVIELVWAGADGNAGPFPWEPTVQSPNVITTNNASIGRAACKPATFLNWRHVCSWEQRGRTA